MTILADLWQMLKDSREWKENSEAARKVPELERRVALLEQSLGGVAGAGRTCDHCGSYRLRRTGNRPDPTFGDLGVKQAVYACEACGKESAYQLKP